MDQRARQPRLRLPGDGGRPGLLLGGQQPAEPPDPLVERPGLRPARRGGLPARRGDAARSGRRPRCRAGRARPCTVRHGQGYTRYTRQSHGLEQDLLVLVPPDDPVKLVRLSVRNNGDQPRRLSATFYAEWVLGTVRENAPLQVVCERDAESGAVLARNAWAGDFAGRLAFAGRRPAAALRSPPTGPSSWAATARRPLPPPSGGPACRAASGRLLDPCAALMTPIAAGPRPDGGDRLRPGTGGHAGTESAHLVDDLHRPRSGPGGAAGGAAAVGPDPGCRPGDRRPIPAWT